MPYDSEDYTSDAESSDGNMTDTPIFSDFGVDDTPEDLVALRASFGTFVHVINIYI